MDVKNILICAENLGIGGVETVIYNQAISLKNKGHNVIIIGTPGEYSKKLEEQGIILIDFAVEYTHEINIEKIEEIIKIIEKHKIDEAHVHKLISVSTVLPALLIKEIPYIVYSHDGLNAGYDWAMNLYPIYKDLLSIFFENSYKIIAITNSAKEYHKNKDNEKQKDGNN